MGRPQRGWPGPRRLAALSAGLICFTMLASCTTPQVDGAVSTLTVSTHTVSTQSVSTSGPTSASAASVSPPPQPQPSAAYVAAKADLQQAATRTEAFAATHGTYPVDAASFAKLVAPSIHLFNPNVVLSYRTTAAGARFSLSATAPGIGRAYCYRSVLATISDTTGKSCGPVT